MPPGGSGMLPEVAACGVPAGARSMLSPLGTCLSPLGTCAAELPGRELAAVVPVAAPNAIAGLDPNPRPAVAGAGPDAGSRANARMIDSGRQLAAGWSTPTSASRPAAVGRWPGSLARQRSISGRISAGRFSRFGGS